MNYYFGRDTSREKTFKKLINKIMNEEKAIIVDKERTDLERISESFWEQSKQYFRDILVITKIKKIWAKKEEMRPMSLYEAVAYVIACRDLGLNPMLNHVIMLEDNFYITLQWHLQNAHNSGTLKSMNNKKIDSPEKVENRPTFRYECIVEKMDWSQYNAIGYADSKTVKGSQYKTDLFLEQMAEARAMRRCLSRAFPVGMSSFEDAIDSPDFNINSTQEEKKEIKAQNIKDKYSKKSEEKIQEEVVATISEPEKNQNNEFVKQQAKEIEEKKEIKEVKEEWKISEIIEKQKVAHETITQDPQFQEAFWEDEKIKELEEEPELTLDQMKDQRSIIRLRYNTANKRYEADPNYWDNKLERDNLWIELQDITKKIEDREMEEINTNPATNEAI